MYNTADLAVASLWPPLPYNAWTETRDTLHMWLQVLGKIKLALAPILNEWWEVAFSVTARGINTGTMPVDRRLLEFDLDFISHDLRIQTSDGETKVIPLVSRSVADFYGIVMLALSDLEVTVHINTSPVEVENTIPLDRDYTHRTYDPDYVHRFWQILVQMDRVFQKFRSDFFGKSSPIQFYWGSLDLSHSRYAGRPAQARAGAGPMERFTMDEEHFSAGFWAGNSKYPAPALYAYAIPESAGLRQARIRPVAAYFDDVMGEFLLPYEYVRTAESPDDAILDFLHTTYDAAASLGSWDRGFLERGSSGNEA